MQEITSGQEVVFEARSVVGHAWRKTFENVRGNGRG
jgi:hypothetical protein